MITPSTIARADASRRAASTQARLRAAAICVEGVGYSMPWPENVTAISEELRLAEHHAAVADVLATWAGHPGLVSVWAELVTVPRDDAARSLIERAVLHRHLDLSVGMPFMPHAVDACRDLGIAVHESWPKGRPVDAAIPATK